MRINPFYTTLLQTLANESPAVPLTSPGGPANGTPPPRDVALSIFVVEDNLVNQRVLYKVLKSLGYEDIRTACNGLEVLQLMREHRADVVLMDVQMPGARAGRSYFFMVLVFSGCRASEQERLS